MPRLIVLIGTLVLAAGANAATLNKCIDARGKVTYSNLPCSNAREARTVNIDPAPAERARVQASEPSASKPAARSEPAAIRLENQRTAGNPATRSSSRQCDALTDKLGRLFDKMDQARRKGYTREQMDTWNREVKDLERKKQATGCF